MLVASVLLGILYFLLLMYFFVLWGRFIVDLVRGINRSWRPRGFVLVLVELVYTLTDPPLKFFRRILPRVSFGPIALDLGFSVTMLGTIVAMSIVSFLRVGVR